MGFNPRLLEPERETPFQRKLLELALICRWRRAHFRPLMDRRGNWRTPVEGDGKGFPDVLLVRRGRGVVAELKSEDGEVTADQWAWLDDFADIPGMLAVVWRPADWPDVVNVIQGGAITSCRSVTELRAGRRPRPK